MEQQVEKKLRIDKWLKIARIFKTRSKAAIACEQHRVIVNDQIAKSAKTIRIGDTITVKYKFHKRNLDILDIASKSISAEKARLLYNEHELTKEEIEADEMRKVLYKATKQFRPKYKGRPTKKERRKLSDFRGY